MIVLIIVTYFMGETTKYQLQFYLFIYLFLFSIVNISIQHWRKQGLFLFL